MADHQIRDQAAAIAELIPKVMRGLFVIDVDDPATGLPIAQMRVCSILRDGPRAMTAIHKELGISLSAVTQIADRLERAGMVERVTESDDRRVRCLQLTAHGLEIMHRRRNRRVRRVSEVLERLSPEKREEVLGALRVLLDAALATPTAAPEEAVVPEVAQR